MRKSHAVAIATLFVSSTILAAGQAQPQRGRGQQTPEQREAAARRAYEEEAAKARPIAALDTVWIEEMTYLEVRDAMKAGKTTALVFAGSTEQNGPYLAGAKHQYAIRLVGEAIARKLGDALIAPVIPLEAGDPANRYLEWGSLYLSADTFRGVVRDVATSLKSQGFRHVVLMGDSGGNTAGMRAVAQELDAAWAGAARIYHVPEYYNWTSPGGVRQFVLDNGIPEKINADGIHDEYGLTAVLMAYNPATVRYDERKAAGKLTINGVDVSNRDAVVAMGRKIVEFRANVAVEAIRKARGSAPAAPAAAASANPAAQGANPRFGSWKLRSEAPAPQSNIMTYAPFGNGGMRVTINATNASGNATEWGYTTMFDGKEEAMTGTRAGETAAVRMITDRTAEITYRRDGRITQVLTNVLSPDGNTIGIVYMRPGTDGKPDSVSFATYERVK